MDSNSPSIFERNPRRTIAAVLLVMMLVFLAAVEIMLRSTSGLGSPPLYMRHPAYGFRLQPNQSMERFHGARFRINNLGLRAERDWDASPEGKVVFLGDSVTFGGNHISNENLFSAVAGRDLPGYEVGNAGVVSWGVENVHGLVVGTGFLPAELYVTTLIEADFFRGFSSGLNRPHIWYTSPRSALVELFHFAWSIASVKLRRTRPQFRDVGLEDYDPSPDRAESARIAVRRLQEMDEFIKSRGFKHSIYVSPTRRQARGKVGVNPFIKDLLKQHGIQATHLVERLDLERYSESERAAWFQDRHHLTDDGHRVWGAVMAADLRKLSASSAEDRD